MMSFVHGTAAEEAAKRAVARPKPEAPRAVPVAALRVETPSGPMLRRRSSELGSSSSSTAADGPARNLSRCVPASTRAIGLERLSAVLRSETAPASNVPALLPLLRNCRAFPERTGVVEPVSRSSAVFFCRRVDELVLPRPFNLEAEGTCRIGPAARSKSSKTSPCA